MKEPDFKEVLVNSHKKYLCENLTDSDIYDQTLTYVADVLDSILGIGFDFSAIQDTLAFYLINSKESAEIKQQNADRIGNFIEVAQLILKANVQLGVLNKALFDMTEQ